MFYKKEIKEVVINEVEETIVNWYAGNEVRLPNSFNNEILTEENKQELDGWEWQDNPPQEYLDWLEEQNNEEEIEM